jgi:hypothetical protein
MGEDIPSESKPRVERRQPDAPRRIVVRFTSKVFEQVVDRDVDETTPVNDVILGTPVQGKSRTTGKPTVTLVEDDQCASFLLTLKGATVSRTVGRNGPAIIHSRTETFFTATKRVVFEAGEGFVAEPAVIEAKTRIINEGIGSTYGGLRGRIVQRRAAPQVAASRPAAEEVVRQKAMRRISAAFDRYLEGRLARLNRATAVRQAIAFVLRGETEPRYSFCTVDGCMQIVASTGPDDQPASAVQLPKLECGAAPMQVWVHESLAGDNLAFLLKRADAARQNPGPVMSTLAALPAAFQGANGTPPGQAPTPVDYAVAEDWLVIQIGEPTKPGDAADGPATGIANQKSRSGAPLRR